MTMILVISETYRLVRESVALGISWTLQLELGTPALDPTKIKTQKEKEILFLGGGS